MKILSVILVILSILNLFLIIYHNKQISKIKSIEKTNLQKEQEEKIRLQNEISTLLQNKKELINEINFNKQKNQEEYENTKNLISEQIKYYKENARNAGAAYIENLEKDYEKAETSYKTRLINLNIQEQEVRDSIKDAEATLETLKSKISSATEAQLRELEMQKDITKYVLPISAIDLGDIQKLEAVKLTLHNPVILSKLIWSTYFQKQTTELCNRVCGSNPICGIYKITNLKTHQCYVGQSVNIQERFKQHIKAGLGIEASSTNKLYKAMSETGVWNFSFEVLEQCPREQLNEAERRWIEIYKANELGYNSNSGIGKKNDN